MRTWRIVWTGLVLLAGTFGWMVAWARQPVPLLLTTALCGMCLTGACWWLYELCVDGVRPLGRIATATVLGGLGLVALEGLLMLGQGVGAAVAAVLVLLSPVLLVRAAGVVRRHVGVPGHWVSGGATVGQLPEDPERLGDADLLRAWRASGDALERSGDVMTSMALVLRRERYLDELARRRPSLFPGVGDDPATFDLRGDLWAPGTGPGDADAGEEQTA